MSCLRASLDVESTPCSFNPAGFCSRVAMTALSGCRSVSGGEPVEPQSYWIGRLVIFNIIDTVNCSFGMYAGEGAKLCQRKTVVGFSEQTSII